VTLDGSADLPGSRIVQASLAGTAVFALTGLPVAAGVEAFQVPSAVISLVLFVVSIPLALLALARAAVRTARQEDRITVTGLFFLQGSAPKPIRRLLLGSLAASLVVAVLSAAREPFGILEPVFPLALCAQWAARHGTFPRIPG
jgi:molybdopterin biosynthesis enzyme